MKLHRNAKTTPTSRLELVRRTVDDGWRYQAVAEGYGVRPDGGQMGPAVPAARSGRPGGRVIQAPADAAHHLASPGDVHSPVAGAARLASLGDRPRVADAAVHGRGLVATLGIEPAAYGPVGAHPALRVAAPGGFVARRHQAAGPVSARRPSHSRQPAPRISGPLSADYPVISRRSPGARPAPRARSRRQGRTRHPAPNSHA